MAQYFPEFEGGYANSVNRQAVRVKPGTGRLWTGLFFYALLFVLLVPTAQAACTDPDGVPGELMYNGTFDVFQGCTTRGWMAFHSPTTALAPVGPEGCPNIGDTCTGTHAGIIYAGEYTGHKYYVAGADALVDYDWNDGSGGWQYYFDLDNTYMPNCPLLSMPRPGNRYSDQSNPACIGAQGKAFTKYLANFTGTGSPYKAASYCYHLGKTSDPAGSNNPLAHGYDDWYLPAVDELEFIYDNLGPQPNHGFQSTYYWSSTESDDESAYYIHFTGGFQTNYAKATDYKVRCVRR